MVQANKKRREIDFGKGDLVWVNTKHWKTLRPSRKLSEQKAGPFKIKEAKGNAFELDLPESIKVHLVFNADKLRKAADDPLPGQELDEPPLIEVDGEHEWELEKVLGVRQVYGGLKYTVQWLGFDHDPEEYWAKNFKNALLALKEFHDTHPDLPGPPKHLDYWIKCALEEKFPEDRPGDDDPVQSRPVGRSRRRGG